jgi:hypothetical protein
MKKILIFITAIFLSIGVFGQDLNYVNLRMMKAVINSKADTSLSNLGGAGIAVISGIVHDSLTAILNNAEDGIAITDTIHTNGKGYFYTQWQVDSILTTLGGGVSIGDVRDEIADSLNAARREDSPIGPLFIFGTGSGVISDTALFNNNRLAGSFINSTSDTLVVTGLNGVLRAGTGTETIVANIRWHATFLSGSAVSLNTTGLTITDVEGTGTADTSFDNNNIPPGARVWCILSGASSGNKPTYMELTMTGYHRNRTY